MPRPDEHPRLKEMGIGEPTCEACMYELFPQAPDDVCTDCNLNPIGDGEGTEHFIRDAAERESGFSAEELAVRHAFGSLAEQQEKS